MCVIGQKTKKSRLGYKKIKSSEARLPKLWWVVLDLNQRPLRCQRNALTN